MKELHEIIEERKEQFTNNIKENKIQVEVIQNGTSANYWIDEKESLLQFTSFLYTVYIKKDKNYKLKVKNKYDDFKIIDVVNDYTNGDGSITRTVWRFYNIPTKYNFFEFQELYKRM